MILIPEMLLMCVLGRVRLGSIRNKSNWTNASKRLFGNYSHSGIPGFPFRLFCYQEHILGDPGAVNGDARKINRRDERFHESLQGGVKEPLGARLLPDHFQTAWRMQVPDWAEKSFVLFYPIGEQQLLRYFGVFLHGHRCIILFWIVYFCEENFQFNLLQ